MKQRSLREDVSKLTYHQLGDIKAEIAGEAGYIPARFYDNSRLVPASNTEPVIVMRGFAEIKSVLYMLARLARLGVPAIAPIIDLGDIPRKLRKDQVGDYLQIMAGPAPYELLVEIHSRLQPEGRLTTLSNSLGGLMVANAIQIDREIGSDMIGDSALINPLGQTAAQGRVEETANAFLWRFIRATAMVTPPWRAGMQYVGPEFVKELTYATSRRTLKPMMEQANTTDLAAVMGKHSIDHRVAIISGGKDTLFPPSEIISRHTMAGTQFTSLHAGSLTEDLPTEQRMADPGMMIYIFNEGRHENMAFPRGHRMVMLGAQALNLY